MSKKDNVFIVSLKLFAITASVALLLSLINYFTKDVIEMQRGDKNDNAMHDVLNGDFEYTALPPGDLGMDENITAFYIAKKDGGIDEGYVVNVAYPGYDGDVSLVIGVSTDSKIMGIKVIESNETPGIGAKVLDKKHLDTLKGLGLPLTFGNSGNFIPVTGATITSNAVYNSIKAALDAVEIVKTSDSGVIVNPEDDSSLPAETDSELDS